MQKTKSRTTLKRAVPTPTSFFDDIIVSLTGIGDMIDVRFQIDEKMKLPGGFYIIDEKTQKIGRPAAMPKIGMLANKKAKIGNGGFAIFWNPDEIIHMGSLVTFVCGGYRREHITVT
jgi:hypothetical protein